jgi:hypothetical protein
MEEKDIINEEVSEIVPEIPETLYTITLADGTPLENLRLNGNNYISETEVDPDIFTDNCSPLIISDGENEETHEHSEFIQQMPFEGKFWLAFRDISKKELEERDREQRLEDLEAVMAEILGGGEI